MGADAAPHDAEFEILISRIRQRHLQLAGGSRSRLESFLLHVRSLGNWEQDDVTAYPDATPDFPATVHVAYAVCQPDCGTKELIIEGSTQECQRCGRLMFRVAVQEYERRGEM